MTQVKQIVTGIIEENCYIIYKKDKALIVDPGGETSKIKDTIEHLEVRPVAVLLTHTHYDHIGSLEDIRVDYDIPVYVSPKEQDWLDNPLKNLSANNPFSVKANKAEYTFDPVQNLVIDDFSFKVVPTPGHSPGGVSFIFDDSDFVITGDALFAGSVGRTDLPGSEPDKLLEAIRNYLFQLPDYYTIFPGHGRDSTIGHEKANNPFFK